MIIKDGYKWRVKEIENLKRRISKVQFFLAILFLAALQLGFAYQYVSDKQIENKLAEFKYNSLNQLNEGEIYESIREIEEIAKAINMLCPSLNYEDSLFYAEIIREECKKYCYDWELILALMKAESNFKSTSVSRKGAVGLMQVMPKTAGWISSKVGAKYEGVNFLHNPEYNIRLGIHYFDMMYRKFDNLEKAITAYRIGPNRLIQNLEQGLEPDSEYLKEVLDYYSKLKVYSSQLSNEQYES
ncbi:MAG: lytic transglycosylase domain-containing protein [bacterium]